MVSLFPQIEHGSWQLVVGLLAADGLLSFAQNIVAFSVLHMVSSLSYAVANASKRIAVITASLMMLHNPVTPLNIFGMLLAVMGVLSYNKV